MLLKSALLSSFKSILLASCLKILESDLAKSILFTLLEKVVLHGVKVAGASRNIILIKYLLLEGRVRSLYVLRVLLALSHCLTQRCFQVSFVKVNGLL